MTTDERYSKSGFSFFGKQIGGALNRLLVKLSIKWFDFVCWGENECKSPTRGAEQSCEPLPQGEPVSVEKSQQEHVEVNGPAIIEDESLNVQNTACQDNHPWFSLVEDLVRLQDELGQMVEKCGIAERSRLQYLYDKVGDLLERHEVTPIDGEMSFAITRHRLSPPGMVAEGALIGKTTRRGWCVGARVLQRAVVEVERSVR